MNVIKTRGRSRRAVVLGAWLLLPAAAIAAALYGPELYRLIQLGRQVDQIALEDIRASGPWPRTSEACIGCHGLNGNAQTQAYPRLAGQPEAYLRKQLSAFASGERNDPTMTSLALSMSEQEVDGLAKHFSKMAPAPNATFRGDTALVARGEALVKGNNCAACHGQRLEGREAYPRLAGQGSGYLRDQLTRFKSGERRDTGGVMAAVTANLSLQDIDAVAQFLASR